MPVEEEVVISGIGGYFPKCINKEEFQKLLLENANFLDSRWKQGERGVTNVIGKIPSIQYFDTAYFGIHRHQCTHMDPMQRILMERTFEALIDAGVNPSDVRGKRVGVFIGSSVGENDNIFYESVVSGFGITGHSRSMMPNRISYWLNLKGPSVDYDSNWMNGLEVLRTAYESIKEGHCDSAIIGTANLVLNVEISSMYNDAKLLSPDGKTRSFDAEANGYGRSDGIVVLYLERKVKAKRSYGTIVNIKTGYNGNREGPILKGDQRSLTRFISELYEQSKVDPSEVNFVEANGCALKDTDEIELNALEEVFCKKRSTPLLVGSVKSNIGHAEASAAMMSIVKLLISMDSGQIPANYNYNNPNPKIKGLLNGSLKVVDKNTPWVGEYGAVNCIGLTSNYGHLLIKRHDKTRKQKLASDLPKLFVLSTRTEEGMKKILDIVKTHTDDADYSNLIQGIFVKPIPAHLYRGYVLAGSEVKQELDHYPGKKRPIWFVYSGMGSQWPQMGLDLMQIPIFAESIKRSHAHLLKKKIDLINIITTDDTKIFENILHSFVGIAAVQIALTDLLRSLGVTPDGMIGHSVGEMGCAYSDGCLTAEQMILAAYARGKASLEAELVPGMMAAVGIGYQQIKNKCPSTIEVACHNGPESCTISGPTKDMEEFVSQLKSQGIFARLVNVSNIAYHSRYIKPAAPRLLQYLKEIIPKALPRSSKWISTSIPESKWDSELAKTSSAEYLTNNLLSSVLFEEGSKHFPKDAIVIEIAPHGLLQAILKRSLPPECTNISLTQRGHKSNVEFLLSGLGRMFISGVDNMKISTLYPKIEYPVARGTPGLTPIVQWEHSEYWRAGNEDKHNYLVSVKDIEIALNTEDFKKYVGHELDGKIILPASLYLMIVYKMLADEITKIKDIVFENLYFKRTLSIPKVGHVPLSAMIQKASGEFEVISEDEIIFSGIIKLAEKGSDVLLKLPKLEIPESPYQLSSKDIYQEFHHRGCHYSGIYKSVKALTITDEGSVADVKWFNDWPVFLDIMLQQFVFHAGERKQEAITPTHIQRLAVSFANLPTSEEVAKISYNSSTGIVYTDAIQISGIKCATFPKKPKSMLYNSTEFFPFVNNQFKKWESGINICLQVIFSDPKYQESGNFTVVEIENTNNELISKIENTIAKYKDVKATYSRAANLESIVASRMDILLIVFYDKFNTNLAEYISKSQAFVLAPSSDNIATVPGIVEIAQFSVNNQSYSLLRKAVINNTVPKVIHVHGDTLTSKDLTKNNLQWVMQFKNTLENLQPKQRLFLVSNIRPYEGVINFVRDVQEQFKNSDFLRFVFLLDKDETTFDDSKPLFKNVLKKDLVLNVKVDGKLGSYLSVPVDFGEKGTQIEYSAGNVISNSQIRFIGLNLKDESIHPEKVPEFGCLDYAAINNSNQRIMGLACIDKKSYQVIPDSIFSWEIPHTWNLEDGALVPYAYSMAYFALVVHGKIRGGNNVLIHSGCSPIGFAAIAVALNHGCQVYTTVATDTQKAFILEKFASVPERNIFRSDNPDFEAHLLIDTNGVGAHVILNNLSGALFEASLRCIAMHGTVIQLGQYDLEQNKKMGLKFFLKNVSFVPLDHHSLFQASSDVKKCIHKYVKHCLEVFIIRRTPRHVVDKFDAENLLREMNDPKNMYRKVIKLSQNLPLGQLSTGKNTFFCNSRSSYLIIGGNAESWVNLVEWLVLRGAKKIIAATKAMPQQLYLMRRLTLLQTYYNVDIIHAPFKADTRGAAAELVSETNMLGPIHAAFLLSDKSEQIRNTDIKSIQHIDVALRTKSPKTLMVNMMRDVTGICQSRSDAKYPTYIVEWHQGLNFSDVLEALDDLLSFQSTYISITKDQSDELREKSSRALEKKLNKILPASIDDLRQQAIQALSKPSFYQISSASALKTFEIPPLFVIPGLFNQKYIKSLSSRLLSPVYCADFSVQKLKISDIANQLANEMENILPTGPFNIIAVSWGGAVAIETAIILEKRGHSTQLYYVDGAPETIQSTLGVLGVGSKKDISLLDRFFNIDPEVGQKLMTLSDWEASLELVLNSSGYTEENKNLYRNIVSVLKYRVDEMLSYNFGEDRRITGRTVLFRPDESNKYDTCGLSKICDQAISVFLVDGDHDSILQNQYMIDIINDRLIC